MTTAKNYKQTVSALVDKLEFDVNDFKQVPKEESKGILQVWFEGIRDKLEYTWAWLMESELFAFYIQIVSILFILATISIISGIALNKACEVIENTSARVDALSEQYIPEQMEQGE